MHYGTFKLLYTFVEAVLIDALKNYTVSCETPTQPAETPQRIELVARWVQEAPQGAVRLAELALLFQLSPEEVALWIVCAAPALHPDLARRCALLHPRGAEAITLGDAAHLLSEGDTARYTALLEHLSAHAPLRRHALLRVEADDARRGGAPLPLTLREASVCPRSLDFVLGAPLQDLPEPLLTWVHLLTVEPGEDLERDLDDATCDTLREAARARRLPVILEGSDRRRRRRAAALLGLHLGRELLEVRADDLAARLLPDPLPHLRALLREARLRSALLYLDLPETTEPRALAALRAVVEHLTGADAVLGLSSAEQLHLASLAAFPWLRVAPTDAPRRAALLERLLRRAARVDPQELEIISRRFPLDEDALHAAASEALRLARLEGSRHVRLAQLDQACRTQLAHHLGDLAQRMAPGEVRPGDLILPAEERVRFDELLTYAEHRNQIFEGWGFRRLFPYGRGLSVLFYGPPGTGKTLAAMIIAERLGLDLYRIDLSRIVSRYVGETEKNLARVFDEAERGRVLLLFDEADSLFTRRTQVSSSTDRYANLEVAFLLQRMESFEGLTVLTTNAEHQLDEAFKRRLRFKIHFPTPDAETRTRLWAHQLPPEAPQLPGIPFELLGHHFELSGGLIKAAALRAAFYAIDAKEPISLKHLVQAATAECREAGVLVRDRHPEPLLRALAAESQREQKLYSS